MACGLSENAKPAHAVRRAATRARSSAAPKTTSSTRSASNSRPNAGSARRNRKRRPGTLYVNKITSNIPGQHKVTWFVEGKRVGSVRLQGEGLARPAGDPRLRYGDGGHSRRRRAGGRGPLRVAARPLREGEPAAHDGAAGRGRARGRCGRRLGRDRGDRASASGRARSPACGSGSRRRGRSAQARARRSRGVGTLAALGARDRRRRAAGEDGLGASSTPAAARSSRRSSTRTASGSGRRSSLRPEELAARLAALGEPAAGGRTGAVRFRRGAARPPASRFPTTPIPRTGSPRGTSAPLAAAGRLGAEAEPAAPNYLRPPDAKRWRERDTSQRPE